MKKESFQMSPPSSNSSRKRPSITTDTASSTNKGRPPAKRVPVAHIMQGLVEQLQIVSKEDEKVLKAISESMVTQIKQREDEAKQAKQAKIDHINHCLKMVLELGVGKN